MSIRIWIAALVVMLAIGLWGWLTWKTHAAPVDRALLGAQMVQIDRVAEASAQLDREIAKARLARDPELRGVVDAGLRWQEMERSFAGADGWRDREVARALSAYRAAAERKRELVQELRMQQGPLAQEFVQLRDEGEAVLARIVAAGGDEALRETVVRLLAETASYSLQARPENGPRINLLLADLGEREFALQERVRGLRDRKDALLAVSSALAEISIAQQLAALQGAVQGYHARLDRAQQLGRTLLAAYAGALLLVFPLIGWRLHGSFAELDAINVNLERLVAQRTEELNRALEELRMQQAHLVQSEKMASLGQMVAGVAHEINTPLGYARSNVETVRDALLALDPDGLRPDVADTVTEAEVLLADSMHGLGQIGELVMSLKNFSRVDRSSTELFDLNEGLETAFKICNNQIKNRITIEREFADLPRIHCAPSKLNQVFLNIITNAAQAIDGEGSIRVRTRDAGDAVEIAIRDSGCGMDDETKAHIFEPFFTTKPVGAGTGLGLSIAFRIVEDHGGSIRVDSKPGEGSEFTLRLPKRAPQRREAPPEAPPAADVADALPAPA